jgi:hypothetical protein
MMILDSFRFVTGGGGGGPTARYWRVLSLENVSRGTTPAISCTELELRATVGGSDQTTTASNAISSSEFSASFLNDYAFDGVSGNFWVSQNSGYGTQWIGYDFGAGNDVTVEEIVWSKRPDGFGVAESPIIALVQYSSDASTWTTYWAFVTPATWGTGSETRTFSRQTGSGKQFWRILVTSVQGGAGFPFSTAELEFRETSGGSDTTTGGIIFSIAANASYPNTMAFDDITNVASNFFLASTAVSVTQNWIGYAYPTPLTINEVTIQVRGDSFGANEALLAATVQSSTDYTNWSTEWTITTPATWANNSTEVRTFTRP